MTSLFSSVFTSVFTPLLVAACLAHQLGVDSCYSRGLALGEVLGIINHNLPLDRCATLVRRALPFHRVALSKRRLAAI